MHNEIKVYGTEDCSDTRNALAYLKSLGLNYDYVDLDTDARAEERVKEYNNGRRVMPTIELISDGQTRVLSNPPLEELADAIENAGLGKKQAIDEDPPIDARGGWRKAS